MIVFIKNEEDVLKYGIVYDNEELTKLKNEIINKCSYIKHKDYRDIVGPKILNFEDYLRIRNYREEKVGEIEYNDFYSENKDLYRFCYDEYIFPYLINIINGILEEKTNSIEELFNNVDNNKEQSLNQKINKLNTSINKTKNIQDKIIKLKELEKLINEKKLNKNQLSSNKYYDKVIKLLHFNLIDRISINDINKINNFFSKSIEINYLEGRQYKKIIDN